MRHLFIPILLLLASCHGVPPKVEPVSPFVLENYLGEWFEIARLDHRFERGLTEVTANYSMRPDGGVKVVNRGFNAEENEWEEAVGKAYFVDEADVGRLKVSFFGPFYGGYNVAKLDADYTIALVVGPSLDYGWILARSKNPAKALCDDYLTEAERIGIKLSDWIWIQECAE